MNRKVLRSRRLKRSYEPQKIKSLLSQAGISRRDLARRTGLNKNTIDNLLTGRVRSPEWSTMCAVCKALNCSLDQLTTRKGVPYCLSSQERKLIRSVRNVPDLELDHMINTLNDDSGRRDVIRQIMRVAQNLPDNLLQYYSQLGDSLVKIAKSRNQGQT